MKARARRKLRRGPRPVHPARQAKSADCDVLQADNIWIAEFAQQKWLMEMTDYVASRKDEFIPRR
jgi:ABC-type glycerol-3-phosphate transport system substrate-binding protein